MRTLRIHSDNFWVLDLQILCSGEVRSWKLHFFQFFASILLAQKKCSFQLLTSAERRICKSRTQKLSERMRKVLNFYLMCVTYLHDVYWALGTSKRCLLTKRDTWGQYAIFLFQLELSPSVLFKIKRQACLDLKYNVEAIVDHLYLESTLMYAKVVANADKCCNVN